MVLELTTLTVRQEQAESFERSLLAALELLRRAAGCLRADALRSHEDPARYLLMVRWRSIDDHMVGFRGGEEFASFRRLLAPFYAARPSMEHFGEIAGN